MNDATHSRHGPFASTMARIEALQQGMTDYPGQLVLLMRQIAHLQKQMQEQYNTLLKPHGLTYITHNALMMVYASEGARLRTSELAAATGEKLTNITRISTELVNKELIRREPDEQDRRAIILRLTPTGRELVEAVMPQYWQLLEDWFAPFSQQQRDTLASLLDKQIRTMATMAGEADHE